MKTKPVKHGYFQPSVQKNGGVFSRLRSMITSNKQYPAAASTHSRTNQTMLEEKLTQLESERKQGTGLAYANMLPPR